MPDVVVALTLIQQYSHIHTYTFKNNPSRRTLFYTYVQQRQQPNNVVYVESVTAFTRPLR